METLKAASLPPRAGWLYSRAFSSEGCHCGCKGFLAPGMGHFIPSKPSEIVSFKFVPLRILPLIGKPGGICGVSMVEL